MVTYPVRINVKQYRGKKQKLQFQYQQKLEIATKIERYLNERMADCAVQTFDYFEIAEDLYLCKETVRDILFAVDGGHNGITIMNPKIKGDV